MHSADADGCLAEPDTRAWELIVSFPNRQRDPTPGVISDAFLGLDLDKAGIKMPDQVLIPGTLIWDMSFQISPSATGLNQHP